MNALRKLRRSDDGVAGIEFALTAPILLLLFFGLIDLAHYVSNLRNITNATNTLADLVTRHDVSIRAVQDIDDYFIAADLVLGSTTNLSDIRMDVYDFRNQIASQPASWSRGRGQSSNCAAPNVSTLLPLMQAGNNDAIVAVICAKYTPLVVGFLNFPLILGQASFDLRQQAVMRPRQGATINCTGC